MKKVLLPFALLVPFAAFGVAPLESCPSGYIRIVEPEMQISDSACPSGTIAIEQTYSCLIVMPGPDCTMYAPIGTVYTDDTGSYEFTASCPM